MQDKPKNLIRYKIRNFLFDYFRKKDYIINNYSGDTNLRNFFNSIKPIDIQEGLIRIGGNNDGGYLVPNVLEGIKYCFSPGVDDNVSFEKELSENYSIKSFMCDLSINSLPIEDPSFKFFSGDTDLFFSHSLLDCFFSVLLFVGKTQLALCLYNPLLNLYFL